MAWKRGGPVDPKYRTRQHRELRDHYVRAIKAGFELDCTADECLFNHYPIVNANGNAPDGLHLGHMPNGIDYAGPQHRDCNLHDAAVRARARQNASLRWVL